MRNWNLRKPVVAREDLPEHHRLAQSLSWPHLVALVRAGARFDKWVMVERPDDVQEVTS